VFRLVGGRDYVEVKLKAAEPTGLPNFSVDDGLLESTFGYYYYRDWCY
jgi:hypothetical protein